jgi:hypothetical protein
MDLKLIPHPDSPPAAVRFVTVQLFREGRGLHLHYIVEAEPAQLVLPAPQKPYRADDLWQTTCFELFVRAGGEAYQEFNFSPSSQWAAYRFESYRDGREPLPVDEPPVVRCWEEPFGLLASVWAPVAPEAGARLGCSAIIEEAGGNRSYWAVAHPAGEPDFHHPDCFRVELPSPATP